MIFDLVAPDADLVAQDVLRAFAEDLGSGDVTADLLPADMRAIAELTCREDAVMAGIPWFNAAFKQIDPATMIEWRTGDGERVAAGTVLCRLSGLARSLVSAERTAMNFLQLLSGTATITARYKAAMAGSSTRLLDTRKTLPGLRVAQKYAVRCGGGDNHRMGLYDAIMLKENHIVSAGGIAAAVRAARQRHPELFLIVEVENLDELAQALEAGVDRIMLDNFTRPLMTQAVAQTAGRVPLEVSGDVTLETIGDFARTGVDFISVGALTKHVRAVDLSLRLHLD